MDEDILNFDGQMMGTAGMRQEPPPGLLQALLAQQGPAPDPGRNLKQSVKNFVGDFMFTFGEALKASASAPGKRGTMAGLGAAMQGPALLEQLREKQHQERQQALMQQKVQESGIQRNESDVRLNEIQAEIARTNSIIAQQKAAREAATPIDLPNIDPLSDVGINQAAKKEAALAAAKTPEAPSLQAKEIDDPDNPGQPLQANFNPSNGQTTHPATGKVIANPKPYQRPQDESIAALRNLQTTLAAMQIAGAGLTPSQRASEINTLRGQWTTATKPVLDRRQAVSKLDTGIEAINRGNYNAATQIIVTAFNKLQDETSVVREGEYARSEQGQSISNRIQGAIERISRGGSNLTKEDLTGLATEAKNVARQLEAEQSASLSDIRKSIEATLKDYKIPSDRVFGNSTIGVVGGSSDSGVIKWERGPDGKPRPAK